jgi:dTMP kinase
MRVPKKYRKRCKGARQAVCFNWKKYVSYLMFLTFEGIDYCGKSTQARLLVERLEKNHTVRLIREPGGTRISERLREILLDKRHLELTEVAELFLFEASRAQLVAEVIRPALERGEFVICDRYFDSTTAYQGFGRGVDIEAIARVNALATGGTEPDLTFVIDIPVEEIERRKQSAGLVFDRMEISGRQFYDRVRAGYEHLSRTLERMVLIDGARPVEEIHHEIWRTLVLRRIIQS